MSAFAQSKKKQIETLTHKVDSLEQVIAKERKITKDKVIELEQEILTINKEKTNALDELTKIKNDFTEVSSNLNKVQKEIEEIDKAYTELQNECKELAKITQRSEIIDLNGENMEFVYPYIEIPSNPLLEKKLNEDILLYTNLFLHYREKYIYISDMGFDSFIKNLSVSKINELKTIYLGPGGFEGNGASLVIFQNPDKNMLDLELEIQADGTNSIFGFLTLRITCDITEANPDYYIHTSYSEAHPDRGQG
jgi:hypothetical protein